MIFTESPIFSRELPGILSEEEYFGLQELLMEQPDKGDLIPESKGLRKIRVAAGGKGKRGGARG